jgi:starch phosphorylase
MKAALNGVPSLSVLDGSWVEGFIKGVTGWAIEGSDDVTGTTEGDSLYSKLANTIVPMFYQNPQRYTEVMRSSLPLTPHSLILSEW